MERCDCLIYCGDDPWLKDGRATPCPAKVKRDAEIDRHTRAYQLLASMGYADLLEAMQALQALRSARAMGVPT